MPGTTDYLMGFPEADFIFGERNICIVNNETSIAFKEKFDFVIFDTPPMGLFIDGAIIASKVDGVLLVINSGSTPANDIKETVDQLEKAKANILGVVLNAVTRENGYHKSSYYRYRYMNKDKEGSTNR